MRLREPREITCEVLIVGAGAAGLRAAIEARKAGRDVLLVSRARVGLGNNTALARGAMAAATGLRDKEDNPEAHFKDTMAAGRFLNDPELVRVVVEGAPGEIRELEALGVRFRKRDAQYAITATPGHSYPRTFTCESGFGTGYTLPIKDSASGLGVRFQEGVLITSLLRRGKEVAGALGFDGQGDLFQFRAKAVILALGGLGRLFLRSNNAMEATGDGHALAWNVGLPLRDMEFVQFYPTQAGDVEEGLGLVYEAFLGRPEAALRNSLGEDILEKYGLKDPMKMTRDNLTRAIMQELLEGRGVGERLLMDLSLLPADFLERARHLLPKGAPPEQRLFPVSPTAHYSMGGVIINSRAETAIGGLYAAGEVCGGVHGANRLGSNSLTACFVLGGVAGKEAAKGAAKASWLSPDPGQKEAALERLHRLASSSDGEDLEEIRRSLREMMWYKVSVIREGRGLKEALNRIQELRQGASHIGAKTPAELVAVVRLENMLIVAELICRAALSREESRGAHYRRDFPAEDPSRAHSIILSPAAAPQGLR